MPKERKFWNLKTKRGIDSEGKALTHVDSRHRCDGLEITHPTGEEFGRGTQFPPHVKASHIREIERTVRCEWNDYRRGRPNRIKDVYEAGDALRVNVNLKRFGVNVIGAFIREGEVATVFPEVASGGNRLIRNGEKIKKYRR